MAISASISDHQTVSVNDPTNPPPLPHSVSRSGGSRSCAAAGFPVHSSTVARIADENATMNWSPIRAATATASFARTRASSRSPRRAATNACSQSTYDSAWSSACSRAASIRSAV
jgi:hypothetical protein